MRDTQDLEYTASLTADEVSNLLSEVRALRAERDRLRDGITVFHCNCLFPGDSCPRCVLLDGEADV